MSMVLRVTLESLGLKNAVILDKIDLPPHCSRDQGISADAGAMATIDGHFDRSRGWRDGS
jgi:hypothetical protein